MRHVTLSFYLSLPFVRTALATAFVFLTTSTAFAKEFRRVQLQPFTLQWMNNPVVGTIYDSQSYPNSVYVLEEYFLNCPYCNQNAPRVNALQTHFTDQPVQILDVGIDCRDSDFRTWITRHSPNHPVLRDCNREISTQLGVNSYPTTIILDCNRNEVKRYVGVWNDTKYQEIIKTVQDMINSGCETSSTP